MAKASWFTTWPAFMNFDPSRILQAAMTSLLTELSEILFLSDLADHRERRKVASINIIGIWKWISTSRCRVSTFSGVKDGSYSFRHARSFCGKPRLAEQANKAWRRVSTTLSPHWVQRGEDAGRILATRSPVGRSWWSILKRNELSWGPSITGKDWSQSFPVFSWRIGLMIIECPYSTKTWETILKIPEILPPRLLYE